MSKNSDNGGYIKIIKDMFEKFKTSPYNEYITIIIDTIIQIKDKQNEPSKNYTKILGFIIFLFILFGYIIFLYNPYNILYYLNLPITILYILILAYLIIYTIFLSKFEKDNKIINVKYETTTFSFTFLKLIGLVFSLFIGVLLIFIVLKKTLITTLNISFFLTIFIFVIFLSIVASIFNVSVDEKYSNNVYIEFLKNLIFYIPCLIIDLITFLKKDYADTPNVTKILFVFLIMVIIVYLLFNSTSFKNKNGIVLIDDPQYLNRTIVNITKPKLQYKIIQSKTFYERALYDIQIKKNIQSNIDKVYDLSFTDLSFADISYTDIDLSQPLTTTTIPDYADKFSRPKYKREEIEAFTSILSEETIPVHLTINEYDKYVLQQLLWDNPGVSEQIQKTEQENKDVNSFINKLIRKQKQLMSNYEKVMLYLSTYFNTDFTRNFIKDINNNNYHYSFSFWIYINPLVTAKNKKDLIYKYGNRPSMYFNHNTKELILEYIETNSITPITLYHSNEILYQKWNNIIINNNYGEIDLFINGNLMGNYKNVVNYKIDKNETLQIGDKNNNDLGGICNFYYYENPLDLNEIIKIYKSQPSF